MHYHAQVVIPETGDPKEHVARMMEPHRESDNGLGLWDWWQIGGRYTGAAGEYDPRTDPRNFEPCGLCDATGKRNDDLGKAARLKNADYTCNGCDGKGQALKWPTAWAPHDGDVIPVSAVPAELKCYTLFLPDGSVLTTEHWNGEKWEKTDFDQNVARALAARGITTGRLVTVDYHS